MESASPDKRNRFFWIWLGGLTFSLLGTQVLTYSLTWTAAGISGALSGIVLTATALPRLLLAMPAGALADRVGPWRIMLASDTTMFLVAIATTVVAHLTSSMTWILVVIGLCIGTSDAFYRPSSGAAPRLLVPTSYLGQATAARQTVNQIVGFVGPALAGVVVTAFALSGSGLVSSAAFLAMAVLLFISRSALGQGQPSNSARPFLHDMWAGVTTAFKLPTVRTILILLAVTAGFVLPLTTLLTPLIGHERGWTGGETGLVSGSFAAGLGVAALLIFFAGSSWLNRIPAVTGLLFSGAGIVFVALAPHFWLASLFAVVAGFGAGTFTVRSAAALLRDTPDEYTSRIQAAALLAQTLPVLVTNNIFGPLSDTLTPTSVTLGCGMLATLVGGVALFLRSTRNIG